MIWVPDIVCEGSVSLLKHHRPRRCLLVPNRRKANYSFLGNANFYAVRTRARARGLIRPLAISIRALRAAVVAMLLGFTTAHWVAACLTPTCRGHLRDSQCRC
jgi:hypothetical protein